jgi:DNA-binding transcriptional LysR family regulator
MSQRTFDLNLLPVLVAIYDQGSVSGAARRLGTSQSAVSAALAKLREKFGDPLFVRVGYGMAATAKMRAQIAFVRETLARVESALSTDLTFDPATTNRMFTFALSDVGEMVFMPKILQRLRSLAPGATVRSVTLPPREIEHDLENGDIDLAVGYFPDLRRKAFVDQHLFTHHFVCLLRADHPIKASILSLKQFLSLEHAVVYGTGRSYEIFERFLQRKKITRRVVLQTPHFMSIPTIIAQSDLIVTVPHAVGAFVTNAHMNIRIAKPPLRIPPIDLKQHWHRKFHDDAKVKWLRGLVATLFTDESDEWRDRA